MYAYFQNYVSEIYIYLMEEMNSVLNNMIENEIPNVGDKFSKSTDMMLLFAMESDEMNMFHIANYWYLEVCNDTI